MSNPFIQLASDSTERVYTKSYSGAAEHTFNFEFAPSRFYDVLRWLVDHPAYSVSLDATADEIGYLTIVVHHPETAAAIRAEFGGDA